MSHATYKHICKMELPANVTSTCLRRTHITTQLQSAVAKATGCYVKLKLHTRYISIHLIRSMLDAQKSHISQYWLRTTHMKLSHINWIIKQCHILSRNI